MPSLTARAESWPIRGVFRISRGERTEARVVVATVVDGDHAGRGECVPYPRYGESVEGVVAAIEAMRDAITEGTDRDILQERMPAGAARNALDCALWDLEAKRRGTPAWRSRDTDAPHDRLYDQSRRARGNGASRARTGQPPAAQAQADWRGRPQPGARSA